MSWGMGQGGDRARVRMNSVRQGSTFMTSGVHRVSFGGAAGAKGRHQTSACVNSACVVAMILFKPRCCDATRVVVALGIIAQRRRQARTDGPPRRYKKSGMHAQRAIMQVQTYVMCTAYT